MAYKIKTVEGNNRKSTKELLHLIYEAIDQGEKEFQIDACGQHNIGGPLWNESHELHFNVNNPGQRLGSMALDGTVITVEGSSPADVGWLNAGGEIIVKGDGGDTTAHCAASGKIYIGGRVGTRSGSLMKHDPAYEPPQFWVLKNTGSFPFEFMGGGIGVICGIDSDEFESVLGDRGCVGMVGGVVFFRGNVKNIDTHSTKVTEISEEDKSFLKENIPVFLKKIEKTEYEKELLEMSSWKKIIAKTYDEKLTQKKALSINTFRSNDWVQGGIFGDIYEDDLSVYAMVNRAENRLRIPQWLNAHYMAPCQYGCSAGIPSQTRFNLLREGKYEEAYKLILEYTPFPGSVCGSVCPNPCMEECSRCYVDSPANIKGLGRMSTAVSINLNVKDTNHKIAVIGSGVGGLTTAFMLRLRGHSVTVFERESNIGGKLVNAVSRERLETKTVEAEIERIKNLPGIEMKTNENVDHKRLESLKKDYEYVVIAAGAYKSKIPPWEGREKVHNYLDFLKEVNTGRYPDIGKKAVVIGCGNSGMDVVFGAYKCGCEKVTAIDIQKPAAFEDEIEHAKSLGAEIKYPAFTEKITDEGVILKDGTFLEADTVFVAIGEAPDISQLLPDAETERGYLKVPEDRRISENVYAIGDITKLGLLIDAIGAGRETALRIHAALNGEPYTPNPKIKIPHKQLSLGYFSAVDTTDFEQEPQEDYKRCISCGTCRDCEMCLQTCPENAISRKSDTETGTFEYISDDDLCIGCGICEGICPCGIWSMRDNVTEN